MAEEKTEAPDRQEAQGGPQGGPGPAHPGARRAGPRSLAFGLAAGPRRGSRADLAARVHAARACRSVQDPEPAGDGPAMSQRPRTRCVVLVVLGSIVMVIGVAAALAQGGFYLATKAVKPKFSKLNPITRAQAHVRLPAVWEGTKILVKSTRRRAHLLAGDQGGDAAARRARARLGATLQVGADHVGGLIRHGRPGRAGHGRGRLRLPAPQDRQADPDDQVRGQAGVEADRGRPAGQGRDPLPPDGGGPQPDDVRRSPRPTWSWSTRPTSPWRCVTTRLRGAPRVVAKGAGAIAAKIREKAEEAGVPLVQDVPLARALHGGVHGGPGDPGRALRRRRPGARLRDRPQDPGPPGRDAHHATSWAPSCPSCPAYAAAGPAPPPSHPSFVVRRPVLRGAPTRRSWSRNSSGRTTGADGRLGRQDGGHPQCHGRCDRFRWKGTPRVEAAHAARRPAGHRPDHRDAGRAAARDDARPAHRRQHQHRAAHPADRDVRAAGPSTSRRSPRSCWC